MYKVCRSTGRLDLFLGSLASGGIHVLGTERSVQVKNEVKIKCIQLANQAQIKKGGWGGGGRGKKHEIEILFRKMKTIYQQYPLYV
jgi:hypothetical protein